RLNVAMDDAGVVGELKRLANLGHDGQRLFGGKPARALDLAEVGSIHELHDEVMEFSSLAEIVDRYDVRMHEPGQRPCFTVDSFGKSGGAGHTRRQDFQGDEAIQSALAGLIDRAHAAFADQGNDFELREKLAEIFGRRWDKAAVF